MKKYIGVDLGGTNVRAAVVSEEGQILCERKTEAQAHLGPKQVMHNMMTLIEAVKEGHDISGLGIGFPGPIDGETDEILMSTNVPGFDHYPVKAILEERYGWPVFVDNDANVAGLAEALVGAGKWKPTIYYVTLSTGIGGAFIVNGKVISGRHGHAGEIANMVIDRSRKKINHLNAGAVECEASGTAITAKGRVLFGEKIRHAGDVFALAEEGNADAMKLVDEACYDLAMMFSFVAHACDPHAFVLGGGMMLSKDAFLDKVIAYYMELVHPAMRTIEFLPAELAEPGIIGAAMLPLSKGK